MIFYHFTSLWNLKNAGPEAILFAGLKPQPLDWQFLLGPDTLNVVWLTTEPSADRPFPRSSYNECRVTVVLQSSDRRLHNWRKYLLKRCRGDRERLDAANAAMDEVASQNSIDVDGWYIYLGAVPLSAFRAVEHQSRYIAKARRA